MRSSGKQRLALRLAEKRNYVVQSKDMDRVNRGRLHRFADWLNDWHVTRIGASLSSLFIVLFVAASFFQLADREEERTARAWTLLTNKAPGNSGKIWALEYLNSQSLCLPFTNLCIKQPEPLTGIDLSPQEGSGSTYLVGVNLSGANLRGAKLMGVGLWHANFTGADLYKADLSEANLTEVNLSRVNLLWADLTDANLLWADLSEADLTAANLSMANLSGADLSGADLPLTDLSGADLSGTNLSGAVLSGAVLSGADLSGAVLSGAVLSRTNLRTARGLTQEQIDSACYKAVWGPPKLPEGLKPPPPCPEPED